ncbi:hypothetical protein PHYSODRAFT_301406 [Phytophthora sojae]|uniref:Endonuclease/exonuclease/phosphatase domain-containing protein n=1 Tax=Phytophthora sojae (strain P6497) TaxID=1094619 RepID=G4ZD20_PHYSP|nr:hypothetical protein PHYSODRAFT_301406 [Phytophthora sojae]EGZ18968.1 hypothetical protein PHYSODRAFT_301406 [Phytophthora sojae]|eukprot:XP_009528026.1 hypothetical protein PHYSODRAFT_301406 [Phytophthora sojae]
MFDYHIDEEKDVRPATHRKDVRIITQNVRGFRKSDMWEWLAAWRGIPMMHHPALIILQETHMQTEAERDELIQRWQLLWGQPESASPLSYWSVGSHKEGGVGVLVFPDYQQSVRPWNRHLWSTRTLGVQLNELHVLNLYAPSSKKQKREQFFC